MQLSSALIVHYETNFNGVQIRPEWAKIVHRSVRRIYESRDLYQSTVREIVSRGFSAPPWWLIGAIHTLEADNVDTRSIRNGAIMWSNVCQRENPWRRDAVAGIVERLPAHLSECDWTLDECLHFAEAWNGWGYLVNHPEILSPYIWSGTTRAGLPGKYTRDGLFDPSAASEQPGVAALLKGLIEAGVVEPIEPARPEGKAPGCFELAAPSLETLMIQRVVNAAIWPETVKVDGIFGQKTRQAFLSTYPELRIFQTEASEGE